MSGGARPVAAARMHHQPHRFVDDDQGVVLEDDLERDVLGLLGEHGFTEFRAHEHRLAAPHTLGLRIGGRTGDGDPPRLQPGLQATAGVLREQPGEGLVGASNIREESIRVAAKGLGWAIIDPVFFQKSFQWRISPCVV